MTPGTWQSHLVTKIVTNHPRYLGIKESRMEGEEYFALIDEFMAAVKLRWPRALVQFEDFQSKYAIKLLQRYTITKLIQDSEKTALSGTRRSI